MTSTTEEPKRRRRGRPRGTTASSGPREQIGAQIDVTTKEQLRRLADLEGLEMAELIRRAMDQYVAQHPIAEAEAEAARRRGDEQLPLAV